jgi:pyrroline-5-carboxylate reductase
MVTRKVGFLGAGNMTQSLIGALIESKTILAENIYVSNRSPGKLQRVTQQFGINACTTNEELIESSDMVFFAVKPQDLFEILESLQHLFNPSNGQIFFSLAAGVSLRALQNLMPQVKNIVRVMPNTPVSIRRGVVGYVLGGGAGGLQGTVEELLSCLGLVVPVDEGDELEAFTVAAASGPGFVFELMQYWQEWLEEHGFDSTTSERIVIETFLGSALLAAESNSSIADLQERVVSKKGVTAAGLESLRELEVERALRLSFEKASLRDRELGELFLQKTRRRS